MTPYAPALDALRDRYDADIWAQFEGWAEKTVLYDGRNLLAWLAGEKAEANAGVMAQSRAMRERIATAAFSKERDMSTGVNETLRLSNGEEVVFKSVEGEYSGYLRDDVPPGTMYKREKAASLVDDWLDIGLVPPTEIIEYNGLVGSAQLFRKNYKSAFIYTIDEDVDLSDVMALMTERQRRNWQLLDEVLGHSDRHDGNWMILNRKKGVDLALIDNGLCLGESLVPTYRALPATGLVLDYQDRKRLNFFLSNRQKISEELSELVSDEAIGFMFERAGDLLQRGTFL